MRVVFKYALALAAAIISQVTTYRETFAGKLRESGVDGLIKLLSDKNRQSDNRFRSQQTGDPQAAKEARTNAR